MTTRFMSAMRKATASTRAFRPLSATRMIQAALLGSDRGQQNLWARWARDRRAPDAPSAPSEPNVHPAEPLLRAPAGTFTARSYSCSAGARDYKLYVPSGVATGTRGLIIMLHGCTQNPDDFATGTGMNLVADNESLIVAYPSQTRAHNASGCWNWFQTCDQVRDRGEPAILAGIARELMREFDLSREQVFIAGLSAGGAMAVIMAETYPDVFSAVGVHSGLPYQSASNVMSALAAMRGRAGTRRDTSAAVNADQAAMRTIIFHGSADKTVHPSNATGIANDANTAGTSTAAVTDAGMTNGKRFSRTIIAGDNGRAIVENWTIEGAGHAWSGGSQKGSFADPLGPDASAEMVRFFLEVSQDR